MAAYRHLARTVVMQTLFALEFRGGDKEATLHYFLKQFAPKLQDTAFAKELLDGVLEHKDEIQTIIESKAPNWPYDKIAPIDRTILDIAVYEFLYHPETPKAVIMNEAIEIAKTFGGQNSAKFVNGVLSSVAEEK